MRSTLSHRDMSERIWACVKNGGKSAGGDLHGKMIIKMDFLGVAAMKRNTLALGLCLLAALFALEAKTACYGPLNRSEKDLRSEKALPADLPMLVSSGVPSVLGIALPLAIVFVPLAPAIVWKDADILPRMGVDCSRIPVSALPYFSSGLFFRPPPASSFVLAAYCEG